MENQSSRYSMGTIVSQNYRSTILPLQILSKRCFSHLQVPDRTLHRYGFVLMNYFLWSCERICLFDTRMDQHLNCILLRMKVWLLRSCPFEELKPLFTESAAPGEIPFTVNRQHEEYTLQRSFQFEVSSLRSQGPQAAENKDSVLLVHFGRLSMHKN